MSTYTLTDETAIDVLIFWIESADGSISYTERDAVKRVLANMKYDMSTYNDTFSHISAMSTEHLHEIVDEAVDYIKSNFSDRGQQLVYSLLDAVAGSDGKISKSEEEKLSRIKSEFGV